MAQRTAHSAQPRARRRGAAPGPRGGAGARPVSLIHAGDERVSDDQGARVFDMPHARVTLTPIGSNVEIEVWPKAGQSAYAVVDPRVAVLIARHLVELAAVQLAAMQVADSPESTASGEEDAEEEPAAPGPDNVVDLASRRPSGGRAS